MSKITKFPNIDQVEEKTSAWLAAIDRGLTNAEQQDLQQWLSESPVHGEALVHFASVWDLMDLVAPVAKMLPLDDRAEVFQPAYRPAPDLIPQCEPRALVSGWLPISGIAAVLMLVLTVMVIFPEPETASFAAVYRTEIGEHSGVMLPDGSRLELNTNSEVSVHIFDKLRRVVVVRGEVYFDVAKNPDAPFVAEVGGAQVIAVGTAFNIELLNASEIEILVTEGKVLIDQNGGSSTEGSEKNEFNSSDFNVNDFDLNDFDLNADRSDGLYLSVGEKAIVANNQVEEIDRVEASNIESDLAWRDGMIIFEGESLEEAINEINRYTALEIEIDDHSIKDIEVGGYFRAGDTDELILVLKNNFGIYSKRQGSRLLLHGTVQ